MPATPGRALPDAAEEEKCVSRSLQVAQGPEGTSGTRPCAWHEAGKSCAERGGQDPHFMPEADVAFVMWCVTRREAFVIQSLISIVCPITVIPLRQEPSPLIETRTAYPGGVLVPDALAIISPSLDKPAHRQQVGS